MNSRHLHIISFDVPYPADYGGVIDVFYRIRALHSLGIKITLHCFLYGREEAEYLAKYTEKVFYYDRKKSFTDWVNSKPFIVQTRRSKKLLKNLLIDDSPILFEGLHTTYWLKHPELKSRTKVVRTHNIEHDYYNGLAKSAKGAKMMYYKSEASKLNRYEKILVHADIIAAIKSDEAEHFSQYQAEVITLPAAFDHLQSFNNSIVSEHFLFHGNLSVHENIEAVNWLIKKVFGPLHLTNQLIITGKNPSENLISLIQENKAQIIPNPSYEELNRLISTAKGHVLFSNQATGVKLKLLNVLGSNGDIIANDAIYDGYNIPGTTIANTSTEFQKAVKNVLTSPITPAKLEERKRFIDDNFDTVKNCEQLLKLIYE